MKYLALSVVNATRSMPLKNGSLLHLQDSYKDVFREVMKTIIGNDYDVNKSYILSGCINSGSGSNYIISAGYIFFGLEVYRVPAVSFTIAGGQTAVVNYNSTNVNGVNYDPVQFTDGNNYNVHYESIMTIGSAVAGSGVSDFANLIRINEHQHIVINPNTNLIPSSTTTGLNVTINKYQQISMECQIQTTTSSVSVVTSLFTIPTIARPTATLRFAGIIDCPVDNVTYPAVVNLYANGSVQILCTQYPYASWKNGTKFNFNATYYIH
jgi:hypothetical protein